MMKRKHIKFIRNIIFNLMGYGLNAILLQLFITPFLSRNLQSNTYGVFLTIISIYQLIPSTIALSLNNLRLIINDPTSCKNFAFYNKLGIVFGTILSIIVFLVTIGYTNIFDFVLFILTTALWIISEYNIVEFRINFDYSKIFAYNSCQCLGYLFGFIIFLINGFPLIIYFLGMLFGYVYTYKNTNIVKEKIRINKNCKKVGKQYGVLLFTNSLTNILGTVDRFIILPLLGAESVAIYSCATIFTKLISLFLSPVNGIILSYISKENRRDKKKFLFLLGVCTLVSVFLYFILYALKDIIIGLLYPTYLSETIKYVSLTIISSLIMMVIGIVGPFVLKHCSLMRQGFINITSIAIYVSICMLLINRIGIYAVCWAVLCSNIIKLIAYCLLFLSDA